MIHRAIEAAFWLLLAWANIFWCITSLRSGSDAVAACGAFGATLAFCNAFRLTPVSKS